jgi:RNA polymerase sigma-70 factor (ECF subfamily)
MDPHHLTSVSLLQRLRGRDPNAWQRLTVLYGPLIRFWCRRGGVRAGDEEDVAQDVFLAIAAGLEGFERQRDGSFRTWLRGITRHKILDYHRRGQRQPVAAVGGSDAWQALQELPDPVAGSTDDTLETGSLYRRAVDLIRSEFEERTFQAFWRAGVEQQPTDVVAAALGMSPVAVRIAKSRVLTRLREEAGELIE